MKGKILRNKGIGNFISGFLTIVLLIFSMELEILESEIDFSEPDTIFILVLLIVSIVEIALGLYRIIKGVKLTNYQMLDSLNGWSESSRVYLCPECKLPLAEGCTQCPRCSHKINAKTNKNSFGGYSYREQN